MSYTAHTWIDGETITAAKLNNLEDGIDEASQSGGGGLTLIQWTCENSTITLSMTVQEIYDGMLAGNLYAFTNDQDELDGRSVATGVWLVRDLDTTNISVNTSCHNFSASSMSDYPSYYVGE